MKIFITGASGFIGRNLREQLACRHEVHAPSRQELDLLQAPAVAAYLKKHHFDIVIHAATWDATRNSRKDPAKIFEHNMRMFFSLERCHGDYGRMFYIGSGQEYGREHWIPRMKEEYFDTHVPEDQAGFSKYLISKHIERAENIFNLRCFGVFGKYEDWEIRFISNACCKALWDMPITIKQNVAFDYLFIDDLVRIIECFFSCVPREKVYNICTGKTYDLVTLAGKVLAASGKKLDVKVAQSGLNTEYSGDNGRLTGQIGPFAYTDMDAAIRALYGWYQQRRDLIDRGLLLQDK